MKARSRYFSRVIGMLKRCMSASTGSPNVEAVPWRKPVGWSDASGGVEDLFSGGIEALLSGSVTVPHGVDRLHILISFERIWEHAPCRLPGDRLHLPGQDATLRGGAPVGLGIERIGALDARLGRAGNTGLSLAGVVRKIVADLDAVAGQRPQQARHRVGVDGHVTHRAVG